LQNKLITANKRRHVNWTVIAVFGLYVQRLDRVRSLTSQRKKSFSGKRF